MAYKIIELPGVHYEAKRKGWEKAYFESLEIRGRRDEPISLTIIVGNYNTMKNGGQPKYFRLRFDGVLEYRFIDEIVSYEDIETHKGDYEFGLIEILDSAYVENMASKGRRRELPVGQRFGKYDDDPNSGGIFERDVRHFRFAQDKWGKLDIIALRLSIEQASSG
jgi:hypothetical protein